MKFDRLDAIATVRFVFAVFGALGFYYYHYQNELLGPLRDVADQHFAFNTLKDLSVSLLGSYVGALLLLGLIKATIQSPEKCSVVVYCFLRRRIAPQEAYKILILNRKIFANIVVAVLSLLLLYLVFTSSIFYFFQFLVGAAFIAGLCIGLGSVFFGGRAPYTHRYMDKPNGLAFFGYVFVLFMVSFVSINLSMGRVEKIRTANPVEVTLGSRSEKGYLVGATSSGVFFLNANSDGVVSFLPNSEIGRIVGVRKN